VFGWVCGVCWCVLVCWFVVVVCGFTFFEFIGGILRFRTSRILATSKKKTTSFGVVSDIHKEANVTPTAGFALSSVQTRLNDTKKGWNVRTRTQGKLRGKRTEGLKSQCT